jgi:hypothetical protein
MTRAWLGFVCFAAVTSIPILSAAQPSMEEKLQRESEEGNFKKELDETNKACGSNITPAWNWDSWGGKLTDGGHHAYLICGVAATEIRYLCNGDKTGEVKTAVQNQIKQFTCKGGATDQASGVLSGTTFEFTGGIGQKKGFKTKDYLLTNLKSGRVSLEEQLQRGKEREGLKKSLDGVNKACGSNIELKEDWDSWGGKLTDGGHHAYLICGVGLDAVGSICSKAEVKTAVQGQIKTFVCHGGAGDQATMKLSNGVLEFTGDLSQKHGATPSPREILLQSLH